VLRHLQGQHPGRDLIYVADQAHVPYGEKSADFIRARSHAITRFLLARHAAPIVVACNTASAAALSDLRLHYPDTPFVGMEPAVKPGALATRSGVVGVLATAGTFESQRYADLMARFARDVRLVEDRCAGLVALIEAGQLDTPESEALLVRVLEPMLAAGADTLVLGCTHYPFVEPLIRRLAGPQVTIIDPAPAVVRQVGRVLARTGLPGNGEGRVTAFTSADPDQLAHQITLLLGQAIPVLPLPED
jgi:glutamate racemase